MFFHSLGLRHVKLISVLTKQATSSHADSPVSDKKTILIEVKPHKSTLIHLLERPSRRRRREQLCLSISEQSDRPLDIISLNMFESDQSWAAGKPGVRGVQLALRRGGLHGVWSGGGRAEGQRGAGVERRMGEGG